MARETVETHGYDSPIFHDHGYQHSAGIGEGPAVHGAEQMGGEPTEISHVEPRPPTYPAPGHGQGVGLPGETGGHLEGRGHGTNEGVGAAVPNIASDRGVSYGRTYPLGPVAEATHGQLMSQSDRESINSAREDAGLPDEAFTTPPIGSDEQPHKLTPTPMGGNDEYAKK